MHPRIHQAYLRLRSILAPANRSNDLASVSPAERNRFHEYFDAASARLDGAARLRDADQPIAALLLYREGVLMLSRAHRVATQHQDTHEFKAYEGLSDLLAHLGSQSESVRQLLLETFGPQLADTLAIDALSPCERLARLDEISTFVPSLMKSVRPVSLRQRNMGVAMRWGSLAVVTGVGVIFGVRAMLPPANVALKRVASASSVAFDTVPAAAVDGKAFQAYGFHSASESSPWLRIDLGKSHLISAARVYGRHDCCFDQSIPMVFEVSEDGANFVVVANRDKAFDQFDPWVIRAQTQGRYVRLRKLDQGVLVLAEVEVEGDPVK